jgi:hypothetical protein
MQGPIGRVAMLVLRKRQAVLEANPCDSLKLLPEAPLPAEFAWAATNPMVAGSFARMAAAEDEIEQTIIPKGVREVVQARVKEWTREPMPLGRAWLETGDATARLALLAAFAPGEVRAADMDAARAAGLDDAALVGVVSWSAFTAARRIAASWTM